MSTTLRHFIRESLVTEIEQQTWMKGTADRAAPDAKDSMGSKAAEFAKNIFNKGLNFLGAKSIFSGKRGKTSWGKKAGLLSGVAAAGYALFSWLKSGKSPSSNNEADKTAVEKAEEELETIESNLGDLFLRSNRQLMDGVTLNSPGASDSSIPFNDRVKAFKDHFEKILVKARAVTLTKNFNKDTIQTASNDYESVLDNVSQLGSIRSQIDRIVREEPAAKAWAARLMVARHAMNIQLAIGQYAEALIGSAKDQSEQQQANSAADDLVTSFSKVPAFKIAFDSLKE